MRLLLQALVMVTGFLFLISCSKETPEQQPVVTVQVIPVQQTTLHHTITADAVLFALSQSAIVPKITAPVKAFHVKRGSRVHAGELLATLENKDLAAAAQDTKGAYEQAQANYEISTRAEVPAEMQKSELELKAARQTLDTQQTIYESRKNLFQQGALPRKEFEQAGIDLTQARNQYELAKQHLGALQGFAKQESLKSAAGQLESAKGRYLAAEADLSYSEIRSPINGVVTDRPLYPGEMASAGTPLLTVMDTSSVVARAHIAQPEAELLEIGDSATITVPGEEKAIPATISVVSPALDPNSTTVEIWAQAKNPGDRLKPGTAVQLSVLAKTIPDALVIPSASLLTAPDGTASVMVVGSDDRAHSHAVQVGIRQGDDVQIVEGLKAGEKIVGSGAYGLPDNTKVRVEGNKSED